VVCGHVRQRSRRLLGSDVVAADSQLGGFSEGLAARVRLANGHRVFIKAASAVTAPAAAQFHRREMTITAALAGTGLVPRLLDGYDDGVWVALAFEEIPGRLPIQPWQRDELDRVLAAASMLAQVLTPAPVDRSILAPPRLGGWRELAQHGRRDALRALNPWAAGHLQDLVAPEEQADPALAGRTLLHGDLYPFNVLLTRRRVVVVDWPHAWIGAAHGDAVTLMSSAALSGIDPQPLAQRHPLTREVDPTLIDVFLALHAGFLFRAAVSAGPNCDLHLRNMMLALGNSSLRRLQTRQERHESCSLSLAAPTRRAPPLAISASSVGVPRVEPAIGPRPGINLYLTNRSARSAAWARSPGSPHTSASG
jgi:hypothetical protein